ncbi:MAG: hypothetical protein J2P57_04385 [Acidimicrobiaceae bacterium]|nr:hypothetical protein [Acidimicrobiaceae bacterium]
MPPEDAEAIRALVDTMPALTAEQRDRIRSIVTAREVAPSGETEDPCGPERLPAENSNTASTEN